MIKIEEKKYFVDIFWGAGFVMENKWVKEFTDYYFCPDPEEFILTHFPEVKEGENVSDLTLLPENNICNNIQEFSDLVLIKSYFYVYDLTEIYPIKSLLKLSKNNRSKITVFYNKGKNDKKLKISVSVDKKDDLGSEDQPNAYLIHKFDDRFIIELIFNDEGEYEIKLFFGYEGSDKMRWMTSHKAIVDKKLEKEYKFPTFPVSYNMSLISPKFISQVMKGTFVDFKLQCSEEKLKDKLFVNSYGVYVKMKLANSAENIYVAKDMYIFNDEIKVSISEGGKYKKLIKYKAIENPENKNVTFPEVFDSPVKLFSPISAKLKANEIYTFIVKCKEVESVEISNNDKWTKMNKEDNGTFIYDDLIPEKGELKILFQKPGTDKFGTAYKYIVE